MNGQHKVLVVSLLLLLVASTSTAVAAVDFTAHELEQLAKGKLVKRIMPESGKDSTVGGTSFMMVNALPETVWKATTDIEAWPHIYPYTYSAEPLTRHANATSVRLRLGVKLLQANIYMTVVTDQASFEMSTRLNKQLSSPLAKDMRSTMKLLPQPGGKTLIVYSCVTDVSLGPIVAMLGRTVIQDMENVLLRLPKLLKQYVEGPSGNKYR
jgi:hypothetical protein